jgi:phosphatidate cytidylyltransferase
VLIPRVLTVLVVLPLFLAALFGLPQLLWGAVLLGIVIIGCVEWARLASISGPGRLVFIAAVLIACTVVAAMQSAPAIWTLLGLALVFWFFVAPVWLRRPAPVSGIALAVAGVLVLSSAWYSLFELQRSAPRLLVLLGVVWIADTAAYFVGRRFGRHKLAPNISPGKTWEGVVGAVAGVGVYYGLLWLVWSPPFLEGSRLLDFFMVVGMTLLSIEGDLFESWIKRKAGVKDSGSILPGHGGVLDRIDGLVAAMPLAALATYVGRG